MFLPEGPPAWPVSISVCRADTPATNWTLGNRTLTFPSTRLVRGAFELLLNLKEIEDILACDASIGLALVRPTLLSKAEADRLFALCAGFAMENAPRGPWRLSRHDGPRQRPGRHGQRLAAAVLDRGP